jgi:hypothetical protein
MTQINTHTHILTNTRTHTHIITYTDVETNIHAHVTGRPACVPDKPTCDADGREVWMLAHKYEVNGVKEWLLEHGITVDSVCAAASFACESVQDVCDGLLEACRKHASWSLPKVSEGALVGVPARAARELLGAHTENIHLGRVCDVAEGFKYVQRWVRTNERSGMFTSAKKEAAESLMEMLELSRLPHSFLSEHVRESGLVSNDKLWHIYDEVVRGKAQCQARLAGKSARLRCLGKHEGFANITSVCAGGTGANARLAVVDQGQLCVCVFSLEEMECLLEVRQEDHLAGEFECPFYGEFECPYRAMFDSRGHLWVIDRALDTIQTFDCQGNFVRCIRRVSFGVGGFSAPRGLALSAQGDIVVMEKGYNCAVVLGSDGRFLHMVPAPDVNNINNSSPNVVLPEHHRRR